MKQTLAPLAISATALFVLFAAGPGSTGATNEELLWRHRNVGKAMFETPTSVAQSVAELKKALDLAPDSYRDRLNYGLALLRAGNNKDSIPVLLKAQEQDPKPPYTWFNLGIAYKRDGRYPEAIKQFEGMLKLVPDEPVSHYNLGMLYNLTERQEDALKQFEIAARLDNKLVAPLFQIYNHYRLGGKEQEAAKALAAFLDAKKRQKAADDSEDMEWCYYAELYDPIQAMPVAMNTPAAELKLEDRKLAGTVDAKSAGMLVIDSAGEGASDLLVWSRDGVRLYRNAMEPVANSGLEGLKGVVWVAAGDFDDDGLPDLCVLSASGPALFHNAKGRFEKKEAALPAGRFDVAVWLDFDHDNDLDLLLFGEKPTLIRNEEGTLREYAGHFPFVAGRAVSAAAFRSIPDTKGIDLAVSYADRAGVLYADQLRGNFTATTLDGLPAGSRSLRAADVDGDSWVDLAFSGGLLANRNGKFQAVQSPAAAAMSIEFADLENRGISDLITGGAIYRNQGLFKFDAGKSAGLPDAVAWVTFPQDGRAGLAAVASDGSLHVITNRTATKNQWLEVRLTGLKVLKLGAGAEVEIKTGSHYEKKIYQGTPLLFGLGPYAEVDSVRITWPNGLIQNEPNAAASRVAAYKEAPRMSGSCPMVFAWNGREFQFISDTLGVAPLGASAGDGNFFPVDSDEYLLMPRGSMAVRNGRYEIRITEELHEVSYIDQVRLIAVDHPSGVEIFTNDKFKAPPFPDFRLFGVRHRVEPVAAHDNRGRDVRAAVLSRDRVYAAGFKRDLAGRAEMHSLTLDFGSNAASANRAILVLSGWIDWADGSTYMAASQGNRHGLVMPYLQVKDASGAWRTVIQDMGVPSGGPKTIVVDLTGKFLSASREVRIVTNTCVYWDQAFLSEDTDAPDVRMTAVDADAASLDLRGFSRLVLDPNREQPEAYRYADWKPAAMWNPVPGLYTRLGDVTELVRGVDDRTVIMGSGDELRIGFDARALPPLRPGFSRTFLLRVDGWSKDADANTAFSQSVEPLPFHGMSQYPYPASERFPDDAAHRAWRDQYNTRRAIKLISPLARAGR